MKKAFRERGGMETGEEGVGYFYRGERLAKQIEID